MGDTLLFTTLFPSLASDPVLRRVLFGKNIYEPWFPRQKMSGEPLDKGVRKLFERWYDELKDSTFRARRKKRKQQLLRVFPRIAETKPREGTHDHPLLKGFGSDRFFGGHGRNLGTHTFLNGPFWIGDCVTIHEPAQIVGPCLISDRSRIGSSAIIKRSIVGRHCRIDGHVHLNDAIIGANVYIGPGAKILNTLDPFNATGMVQIEDFRGVSDADDASVMREWRRRGALIGDGCVIGADAILMPGVVLLPECRVPIGARLTAGIYDGAATRRLK